MKYLWKDQEAADFTCDLALRVYTSRLLGRDKSLVLHGGGNTSVKIVEKNIFGEDEEILYVKGSGWDLEKIEAAAREAGIEVARGGAYLVMVGPQFSSHAESEHYRSWNCDVIGMTNLPEAKLALEAELCYATVVMVADYDCWHPNHDDVTVDAIIKVLLANAENARSLVKKVAPRLHGYGKAAACNCRSALEHALITAPEARDPEMVKRLDAVAGRMLNPP